MRPMTGLTSKPLVHHVNGMPKLLTELNSDLSLNTLMAFHARGLVGYFRPGEGECRTSDLLTSFVEKFVCTGKQGISISDVVNPLPFLHLSQVVASIEECLRAGTRKEIFGG
jgi:hypothetical protein